MRPVIFSPQFTEQLIPSFYKKKHAYHIIVGMLEIIFKCVVFTTNICILISGLILLNPESLFVKWERWARTVSTSFPVFEISSCKIIHGTPKLKYNYLSSGLD